MTCEVELAFPEIVACSQSLLPSSVTDKMFNLDIPGVANIVSIEVDNVLSPCHTLLKVFCTDDHKGLVYDIMRTLKDYNIQVKSSYTFLHLYLQHVMDIPLLFSRFLMDVSLQIRMEAVK